MKTVYTTTFLFALLAVVMIAPAGGVLYAQGNSSGYGGERVEVCRATASRFNPYVKVTVPFHVATSWVASGSAVYPINGECPKPEQTLREYIQERIANALSKIPSFAGR